MLSHYALPKIRLLEAICLLRAFLHFSMFLFIADYYFLTLLADYSFLYFTDAHDGGCFR